MPALLAMLTAPLPPSGVTASAEDGCPGAEFSDGEDGSGEPAAQAVTVVGAVAQLDAMLSATAPTPVAGTLPTPRHRKVQPAARAERQVAVGRGCRRA